MVLLKPACSLPASRASVLMSFLHRLRREVMCASAARISRTPRALAIHVYLLAVLLVALFRAADATTYGTFEDALRCQGRLPRSSLARRGEERRGEERRGEERTNTDG
jgi:hypothetical protein